MQIGYFIIKSSYLIFMKIFCHLQIIGKEKLADSQNCIIASNHISAFDPPFLGAIFPQEVFFLAKAELFKNKFFGKILEALNSIPIKRGRIDRTALKRVHQVLANKRSIIIFPEGTRKATKVKSGVGKFALEMKVDILPILIENSDKFWQCFFRKKRLIITIGDKIRKEEFSEWQPTKENYRKLADHVFQKIKSLHHES